MESSKILYRHTGRRLLVFTIIVVLAGALAQGWRGKDINGDWLGKTVELEDKKIILAADDNDLVGDKKEEEYAQLKIFFLNPQNLKKDAKLLREKSKYNTGVLLFFTDDAIHFLQKKCEDEDEKLYLMNYITSLKNIYQSIPNAGNSLTLYLYEAGGKLDFQIPYVALKKDNPELIGYYCYRNGKMWEYYSIKEE